MAKVILVTGTDTGVGKTVVCGLLTSFFYQQGIDVSPLKPVETGCVGDFGPDTLMYSELTNISPSEICPYSFKTPVAPLVAMRKEGREISIEAILQIIADKKDENEIVIIEGAGGLMVPIVENYNYLDLAKEIDAEVLVVVGSRLGALNHALLTFKALEGVKTPGYVLNEVYPSVGQEDALETNREILKELAGSYGMEELGYLRNLGMVVGAEEISKNAIELEEVVSLAKKIMPKT